MKEDEFAKNSKLVAIAQSLSEGDSTEKLLELIISEALSFANADAGSIYIRSDRETLHFECLVNRSLLLVRGGTSGVPVDIPDIPLSGEVDGQELHFEAAAACRNGETRLVQEGMSDRQQVYSGAKFYADLIGYEIVSALSIPLSVSDSRVIGVLQVLNAVDGEGQFGPFAEDMIPWIESLASLAAVAIYNRQRLDSQVAMHEQVAHQVQRRTLELETVIDDLQTRNARLQEENMIDGLTSVNNRLAFEDAFKIEWRRAERQGYKLSLLMLDIDHFKEVNDTFGHLAGDQCLRIVSHLIKSAFNRSADFVARYGGEEFVVLLPYLELDSAILCAERLRAIIEAYVIEYTGSEIRLTASVGVSCVQPSSDTDATQLIKLADKALYSAKDAGRNCVRSIAVE